jgi:DNA-binding transcriptional regulator YdaS (Cro superfamily)
MKIKEGMEVNSSIKALVNIGLSHPNLLQWALKVYSVAAEK